MPDGFDFHLPPERVARYPSARRDSCKLMVIDRHEGTFQHRRFRDLRRIVPSGDALVLNTTSVLPARLRTKKATGARIELLLLSAKAPDCWTCLVRPSKRVGPGVELLAGTQVLIVDHAAGGGRWVVRTADGSPFRRVLNEFGEVPIPPYLRRAPIYLDRRWYQTVFAQEPGSVAAPTAGLHFTPSLLEALRRKGVGLCNVVVHLGTASFLPVNRDAPSPEPYQISAATASVLNRTRAAGAKVIAVGTSTARALETCAQPDRTVRPGRGMTEKVITPPYRFRGLDSLVTNFHLPGSSHLMVVEALLGTELLVDAYQTAIDCNYRFYSYGDAMLIL